jgi:hypothetical protein
MEHQPPQTAARGPGTATRATALVLAAGATLGAGWIARVAPFPYAWRDVALVQLACALPAGWLLAMALRRRLRAPACLGLAALLLCATALPFLVPVRESLAAAVVSQPLLGVALRAGAALGVALAFALAVGALTGARPDEGHGWTAAALGIAILVPCTYVAARCRHDADRLAECLEQSRIGDAAALARGLLALGAGGEVRGRPLPDVAAAIERAARDLAASVADQLPEDATDDDRLERARRLAMLGRRGGALEVLRGTAASPEVECLAGTTHEDEGRWDEAVEAYHAAWQGWKARRPSRAREAGLLRAATGVGYCERKRGRYAEAEAAYRHALVIAPTADTHFLLAQFYEDTQQTGMAQLHARRAIQLDPARYRRRGERLLNKLAVYHFGCLAVSAPEGDAAGASRPARSDAQP